MTYTHHRADEPDWIRAELDEMARSLDQHPYADLEGDQPPPARHNGANGRHAPTPSAEAIRARLLTSAQLAALPPPRWQVEGWVPQGGLTVLYGAPGCGKSFAALDIAASVATDRPWQRCAVEACRVLYVAAESPAGMGRRLAAWSDHHTVPLADIDVTWHRGPINLFGRDIAGGLVEVAAELRCGLVVIDTLARCMVGGDESATKDMGVVIESADRLCEMGVTVLIIHHSGKDPTKGHRGSSALLGAADASIVVHKTKSIVTLRGEKEKDADTRDDLRMRLTAVSGSAVLVHLAGQSEGSEGRFTYYMEQISNALAGLDDPVTSRALRAMVRGKTPYKDAALATLIEEGYVVDDAVGRGHSYRLVTPYRAAEDPFSDVYEPPVEHEPMEDF